MFRHVRADHLSLTRSYEILLSLHRIISDYVSKKITCITPYYILAFEEVDTLTLPRNTDSGGPLECQYRKIGKNTVFSLSPSLLGHSNML